MANLKIRRIAVTVCRILLGAMFVFSGFVKVVDPMGTAIKLGEYFSAFGMDFLNGWENAMSIAQSAGEMTLGFMLIFGIYIRLSSTLAAAVMGVFTFVTLYIAIKNPVADCGCFGDAIKLSNWGTFIKNAAVLLPLSIVVVVDAFLMPRRKESFWNIFWILVLATASSSIGIYALRHLPLMDFLPYKKGVNITEAIRDTGAAQMETKVVCRNIDSGEQIQFSIEDTIWYDTTRWEYVETIIPTDRRGAIGGGASNFAVLSGGEDVTLGLLESRKVVFLFCIKDPAILDEETLRRFAGASAVAGLRGYATAGLTPVPVSEDAAVELPSAPAVMMYNMDDTTLKSLLRADNGLVVIVNGVIRNKFNARDIPAADDFPIY